MKYLFFIYNNRLLKLSVPGFQSIDRMNLTSSVATWGVTHMCRILKYCGICTASFLFYRNLRLQKCLKILIICTH